MRAECMQGSPKRQKTAVILQHRTCLIGKMTCGDFGATFSIQSYLAHIALETNFCSETAQMNQLLAF